MHLHHDGTSMCHCSTRKTHHALCFRSKFCINLQSVHPVYSILCIFQDRLLNTTNRVKTIHSIIAVTTGEPAGIGPDICLMQANRPYASRLVFIGCPELLAARAKELNLSISMTEFDSADKNKYHPGNGHIEVLPVPVSCPVKSGHLNADNSHYVLRTLQCAVDGCRRGLFEAMVTAPVHKGIINEAGMPFSGHTEWLAQATHTSRVVMVLACEGLRVALATTHLPLSQVPSSITQSLLHDILNIINQELINKFFISVPHIFVCGLNPHAGENGYLGTEEIDTIIPVIEECRKKGMKITGPLPADTIFNQDNLTEADIILAMYHDQGLPVLKYKGFGGAVNITLGLPFIRTLC